MATLKDVLYQRILHHDPDFVFDPGRGQPVETLYRREELCGCDNCFRRAAARDYADLVEKSATAGLTYTATLEEFMSARAQEVLAAGGVLDGRGRYSGLWTDTVTPKTNWELKECHDFEDTVVLCPMCEKEEFRYGFEVRHRDTGALMIVGCNCCSHMCGYDDDGTARLRTEMQKMSRNEKRAQFTPDEPLVIQLARRKVSDRPHRVIEPYSPVERFINAVLPETENPERWQQIGAGWQYDTVDGDRIWASQKNGVWRQTTRIKTTTGCIDRPQTLGAFHKNTLIWTILSKAFKEYVELKLAQCPGSSGTYPAAIQHTQAPEPCPPPNTPPATPNTPPATPAALPDVAG